MDTEITEPWFREREATFRAPPEAPSLLERLFKGCFQGFIRYASFIGLQIYIIITLKKGLAPCWPVSAVGCAIIMSLLAQLGRAGAKRLTQTSIRPLYQLEQLRLFAAEPVKAAADDDLVLASFRNQQRQYQAMMQGLQNIAVPLTGDEAAVKKYAQEVEALKKKVGMPDYEDTLNAELDYAFACSGYDVKKFVTSVLGDLNLGSGLEGVSNEISAAVEAAEAASGRELDAGNDKGWQVLSTAIANIEKKYGLQDKAKVREEAVFDMYKKHISSLREAVEGDVDKARAAEKIEVKADLNGIKPKLV